jgi:hypothetical protein
MSTLSKKWSFSFQHFQPKFDKLLAECVDKLKQSISNMPGHMAQGFFIINIQMCRNAWHTVAYLCANQRATEAGWMWDYVLLVPAINRTILDSLFNVVFMLEDLPTRSGWFYESGWRETKEQMEREKAVYAGLPEWQEYLQNLERIVQMGISQFSITPDKISDLKKIKYWPNPGKMVQHPAMPQTGARQFLQYMNDWFYRELSSQTHLSSHGIQMVGMLAIRRDYGPVVQKQIESEQFESFRAQQVTRTAISVLCVVTEVNQTFALKLDNELKGLWADLVESIPESLEVFDKRYAAFFGVPPP